jgi:magnesium transporter
MRQLVATAEANPSATPEGIRACMEQPGQGIWLDIEAPDQSDFELLGQTFGFHELTLEDVRHQNQRPKLEEYGNYSFVVLFSAEWEGPNLAIREHHLYLSARYLVSVHQEPSPPLERLRDRLKTAPELSHKSLPFLFYLVVDQLVDSLFPVLERLDDQADEVEDVILARPDPTVLATLAHLKRATVDLRKVLGAQRDVFQRLTSHAISEQGGEEMSLYYRDVYDHLVRQYETVDSLRDVLTSTMDVYLSTVSARLNDVMRRLTVIATLFLPLSFITGFFGMNFAWLVNRITAGGTFALGIALMALTVLMQLAYFRRRGWA